ncbi:MAG: Concanavalin A-like lectin/glucanase superfamily [Frankiales bacterium]|nr:Concanavalin A-like lectin/glucanase superfamily [Frankiales bacterium]
MRGTVVVALLLVSVTACAGSSSPSAPATTAAPVATSTPSGSAAALSRQQVYQSRVLADRPLGLWTLRDVAGITAGGAVEDAGPSAADAVVVEGGILATSGPAGLPAAKFTGKGRIVTPLVNALRPGRPFTVEFLFRADDCTRNWTQVAGTASYNALGRQGVNVLHYPRFVPDGCHVAVEFWKDNHYSGGCGLGATTHTGTWRHVALTYDGKTARCYASGRLVGTSPVPSFGFVQGTAFGIGGSGPGYSGTLDSGSLADVAVYARALPAAVLQADAKAIGR